MKIKTAPDRWEKIHDEYLDAPHKRCTTSNNAAPKKSLRSKQKTNLSMYQFPCKKPNVHKPRSSRYNPKTTPSNTSDRTIHFRQERNPQHNHLKISSACMCAVQNNIPLRIV